MSKAGANRTRYRFVELAVGLDEIWCGEARAFLLAPPGVAPSSNSGTVPGIVPRIVSRIVQGRCPHRGGPLALGSYECRDRQWRCPWHGHKQAVAEMQADALPAIRRLDHWLVAIAAPLPTDEAIALTRRAADPDRPA